MLKQATRLIEEALRNLDALNQNDIGDDVAFNNAYGQLKAAVVNLRRAQVKSVGSRGADGDMSGGGGGCGPAG